MQVYHGSIISGDIDETNAAFTLKLVKHLETQSLWTVEQLRKIEKLLSEENDGFTMTINDSLPLLLSPDEQEKLCNDIREISSYIES